MIVLVVIDLLVELMDQLDLFINYLKRKIYIVNTDFKE